MRLHSLEITAFGPFTDTVEVEFDALSEAGLFLLSGATGAGKSSVLDAVCFALYGDVPGDRGAAKRLRSDQAPADRAPRVVLEATLAGRRFLIDRSPAWERPKKRGTGTTVQQASVAISEWVEGGWTTRSTRLDETGHLVTALVGMNLPQFCQVAMLPQGRFQAFLRARSEERHALLARLFRTGRFEAVERWLRERRATTRRASLAHQQVVVDLLSRLSETAGVALPEEWEDLPAAAEQALVGPWVGEVLTAAGDHAHTATQTAGATHDEERSARTRLEEGRVVAERRATHAAAADDLAALTGEEPRQRDRLARLDDSRRAAGVAPLLALVDEAAARHATASVGSARATTTAGAAPGTSRPTLASHSRSLLARRGEVVAALPRAEQLPSLRSLLEESGEEAARATVRRDELRAALEDIPDLLGTSRAELAAATAAAAALPGVRQRVQLLEDRRSAAELVTSLRPQRELAAASRDAARTSLHEAREHWLAVREARLEGMASELAGRLAVGGCCPVCGSADHPQPAAALAGAPDAAAEKVARSAVDDAESLLLVHAERLRELDTRLVLATQQAGDADHETMTAEHDETLTSLRLLQATADQEPARTAAVHALEQRRSDLETAVQRADDEVHRATARRDDAQRRLTECRREVDALLDGTDHDTLASLLRALEHEERLVTEALAAVDEEQASRQALDRAQEAAAAAAARAGFSSTAEAGAAVLGAEEAAGLEREASAHRDALARARSLVADPALADAAARPEPDLPALTTALRDAEAAATAAARTAALASRRHERLRALHTEVQQALAAWAPVRRDHALAASMASLVDGTSSDNRLQMRLSAYVLAHRLGQVVEAANERLSTMIDHRYTLEHTGRRGAGETRGGLSLLVRDDWSGEARDPATLSGGETFVVSLALALGLADVITQEAGGADLDTLFVDEGFGSLDAETLDHVMGTLDALRDGGRVVGVVSHVEEMRDRIPVQLRVAKGRAGSSLAVHAGGVG